MLFRCQNRRWCGCPLQQSDVSNAACTKIATHLVVGQIVYHQGPEDSLVQQPPECCYQQMSAARPSLVASRWRDTLHEGAISTHGAPKNEYLRNCRSVTWLVREEPTHLVRPLCDPKLPANFLESCSTDPHFLRCLEERHVIVHLKHVH